ncbi:hypothetical protein [Alteromonas australica]|uniref:Uncharacterized protein n=1 Tax=Alteromonas australica TaxID=589873 RepID=A0A075NXN3_9ALTE|nr:hypothetical protein [Alteromonas australica]AIF98271.1 hypothetical protein EP13_05910 [Alteromonas australica]
MFDEKYIMTGLMTMALIAAWQKPSLFREHIVNKIMFLSLATLILFAVWTLALDIAFGVLPSSLTEDQIKEIEKNFKAISIPISWWVFDGIMYVSVFVLDWLASVSLAHEKKN